MQRKGEEREERKGKWKEIERKGRREKKKNSCGKKISAVVITQYLERLHFALSL